jgi:hypothetical protein
LKGEAASTSEEVVSGFSAALASIEVIVNRSGNGVVRDCSELMGHVSRLGDRQVRSLQLECLWSPGCAARAADVDNLGSNVVERGLLRGSVMGERHNTALQLAGTRVERGGSLPCASPGQQLGRLQGFDELIPPQLNASRYGDMEGHRKRSRSCSRFRPSRSSPGIGA